MWTCRRNCRLWNCTEEKQKYLKSIMDVTKEYNYILFTITSYVPEGPAFLCISPFLFHKHHIKTQIPPLH